MTDKQDNHDEHENSDCQQMFYALANFMEFALRSHDPVCVTLGTMQAIGCTLDQLDIASYREGIETIKQALEIIEQQLQERLGEEMSVAEEATKH